MFLRNVVSSKLHNIVYPFDMYISSYCTVQSETSDDIRRYGFVKNSGGM